MHSIAIFGGTFNPVHNGHLLTSISIQSHFNFNVYNFLPCKIPLIKPESIATNKQRIEMLKLAIEDYPQFKIDLREMNRETPSYMVDTLISFRRENKKAAINLIIGYDAFLSLPKWYHWEEIINLANLLVINRTQFINHPIPDSIKKLLSTHKTEIKSDLLTKQAKGIYFFDAGNYLVSSTKIREELKSNAQIQTQIPPKVYKYIKQWGLYQ